MYPVFPVEAARDELVASLKSIILSRLGQTEVEGEVLTCQCFLPLSLHHTLSRFALSLSLSHSHTFVLALWRVRANLGAGP